MFPEGATSKNDGSGHAVFFQNRGLYNEHRTPKGVRKSRRLGTINMPLLRSDVQLWAVIDEC